MSNGGSLLDTYLICQALGWNWDLGSIVLITGMEIFIILLIIVGGGLIGVWRGWI